MAISLIGEPVNFTPAYNPIYWYFDSDNKTEPGFRYIVDIYERTGAGTQELIKRVRISPRPLDGYCEIELSKTLQTYVTNQLPTDSTPAQPTNSFFEYNIEVGEEYGTSWTYDAFEQYASLTPANYYNQVVLTTDPDVGGGSLDPHPYIVGDQIVITQSDGGVSQPSLTGLFTVVADLNTYSILINQDWVSNGTYPDGLLPGTITYADGRKTIYSGLYTNVTKSVFNGAISHMDFIGYTNGVFLPNTTTPTQLVTTCPVDFGVTDSSTMIFNIYNQKSSVLAEYMYFQNNLGTVRRADISDATALMKMVGVGPGNFPTTTLVSGSGTIIQTGVTDYLVWTAGASPTFSRSSLIYRFTILEDCSKYTNYEVSFMDRLGSLGSFSFFYDTKIQTSIKRTDQKFQLGAFDFDSWVYTSTDRGSKVINTDISTTYELNTAWLTQDESDYFQELLSSPVSYIKIDGYFWPCIITNSRSEKKDIRTEHNIKYKVTLRLANNNSINF